MVSKIVRAEQLLIFCICLIVFYFWEASWWYFLGWLLPDLGMLGYLKNKQVGRWCYNISHNYLFCIGIFLIGYLLSNGHLAAMGIVFCSHVALDRFLGFGLKYPTGFKDTHIQRL